VDEVKIPPAGDGFYAASIRRRTPNMDCSWNFFSKRELTSENTPHSPGFSSEANFREFVL
jgi:hypothetical protein